MTVKKIIIILFSIIAISSAIAGEIPFVPVVIDYFYQPDCSECIKVRDEVLPKLEAAYSGLYKLNEYDLGNITNLYALIKYQEVLDIDTSAFVYLVVDYSQVICGSAEAEEKLLPVVEEKILDRYEEGWGGLNAIEVNYNEIEAEQVGKKRLENFTLGVIIVAGLVDGINPCAMAAIIFFITFLTAHRVKKSRLLLAGLSFCFSCFIVYMLIGLGAFKVLFVLREKFFIKEVVEWLFIVGLICLSLFSVIDAIRLKYGKKEAIIKLPSFMGKAVRRIIRGGFSTRSAVLYGGITGGLVTLIESACTSQAYLPTLQLLVKLNASPVKVFSLLAVYNLMFIMPLLILLGIALKGINSYRLVDYMKKHAVFSKIIMAIFFLLIALLLILF